MENKEIKNLKNGEKNCARTAFIHTTLVDIGPFTKTFPDWYFGN